jgi:hypothetical protein
MQTTLVENPRPAHPLGDWFEPEFVNRFRAAGLATVGDLIALFRRRRQHGYVAIPRFGPRRAQRIVDGLSLYVASLCTLSPHRTDAAAPAVEDGSRPVTRNWGAPSLTPS